MSLAIAISVVIPCYNSVSWLAATISSVEAQTRRDIEIILVDDGSTDATPELIHHLLLQTDRLPRRCIRQANAGVAAARNLGIAQARGRYILPLDADDLLHPDMLSECAAILDSQPELDLVYVDRQDFGDSNQLWPAGRFELSRLKYFNQLAYCSLYRRDLWQAVGGYRSNVRGFDDWDFWLSSALQGARAHHLPQPYLLHRRHAISQLWGLLDQYEALYARIILNNAGAFSLPEQAAATAYLQDGTPASLLQSSRFLFLRQYYAGYPIKLDTQCAS